MSSKTTSAEGKEREIEETQVSESRKDKGEGIDTHPLASNSSLTSDCTSLEQLPDKH